MKAIIVGAGFAGAVTARQLADAGWDIDLIEKRPHIAGNMYDEIDKNGILLHKYGPHLFHTESDEVRDFLARFGVLREFVNYTTAYIDGCFAPMPFNLNAVEMLLGSERALAVQRALTKQYGQETEVPVLKLLHCGVDILEETARFFYEKDYAPYTQKQWGKLPDEVDPSVTARVPFRNSRDNRLFRVKHQFLPQEGYTALFTKMLKHERIHVKLNTNALEYIGVDTENQTVKLNGKPIEYPLIFTGAADELLGRRFGALPYRSLEFVYETHRRFPYQATLGVCYPSAEIPFTRILEYRHLMQDTPATVTTIVKEIPLPYNPDGTNGNIPYYPMMTEEAAQLYLRYRENLDGIPNLYLLGRLAEYRYYNMDQVILRAFEVANEILNRGRQNEQKDCVNYRRKRFFGERDCREIIERF